MRSCNSGRIRVRSPAPSMSYAVPRSSRRTAESPHCRAMSVAFDDQGEMVPSRGVTRTARPAGPGAGAPYVSRRARVASSRLSRPRSTSTKCQKRAEATVRPAWQSRTRALSLSRRNGESATPPPILRTAMCHRFYPDRPERRGPSGRKRDTMAGMSRPVHVLAKPTGAVCNLDCKYCFFLSKEELYPGSTFRMRDDVLDAYIQQMLQSQQAKEVVIAWQGGEPTLMGLEFFERSMACV